MSPTKKENKGCLPFFILGVFSFLSFIVIRILFPFSVNISGIIAIVISIIFLKYVFDKAVIKNLIKSGFLIYFLLFGLQFVFYFFLNILNPKNENTISKEERTEKIKILEENDSIVLYTSNRNWRDNYGNNYIGNLSVREKDYHSLKNHINNYKPSSEKYFWGELYAYISQTDTPSLDLIMEMFVKINQDKNLNQMEFAEMVVSCIQDIPYSFVLQKECPTENYDSNTKHVLEDCPECCIGNIKYGIQNPVSFIKNLKGDCDTRTVIIYSILNYFNYDVAIVNSNFYRHSIIGINLPASGLHKIYKGKKYTLWETTAKYFEPGYLSPGFDDVAHWNIVLTSK